MSRLENTLSERRSIHGDYVDSAMLKDTILTVLEVRPEWLQMDSVAKETIRMIVEKLGRIVCGKHTYPDHWLDIAGYATLAERFYNNQKQTSIDVNAVEEGV